MLSVENLREAVVLIDICLDGFTRILEFLENAATGRSPTAETVNTFLETETMEAWGRAYAGWPEFDHAGLREILTSLLEKEPVGKTRMMKMLEDGFRRALTRLDTIRENFARWQALDFAAAEKKALVYLPLQTELKARIHFTIDAFNGGFFHGSDVFFSLLEIYEDFFGIDGLAHELHHTGVRALLKDAPRYQRLAASDNAHQKMIAQLAQYLVSEGLANFYCSPRLVGLHPAGCEHSRAMTTKLRDYQNRLPSLFSDATAVLIGAADPLQEFESCREKLQGLMFDPDGVLPPGHYLSARLVEPMERSSKIEREEIIDLCRDPMSFFALYNRDPIDNTLRFPDGIVARIEKLS